MTQRLTGMSITRVSLVDKGANAKRLAVLKRDEEVAMTGPAGPAEETPAGLAAWLHKAADAILGRPARVAKAATFAEVVAGQELRDALYDSWYTLEDVLWGAIYATDETGVSLSMAEKTALVGQDLDEFKAYLVAQMETGVSKAQSPSERAQRQIAAVVAKAGRKISGDRLGRLQSAAETLNGVLEEVVEVTEEAEAAEEEPVDKTELAAVITEAVTKGQEPLVARLEALEKSKAEPEPVKTEEPAAEGDDGPVSLATIAEAIGKLADRIEVVESTRGVRKSADGQESTTGEPVKKSVFAGILD